MNERPSSTSPLPPLPPVVSAAAPSLPDATLSESGGVRYLHLGSIWIQGAMRIGRPQVVELDYVQRMLASLLWLPKVAVGRGRAVQLGLGAAAITRFTQGVLGMQTTAVEINPQVLAACRTWFHLPKDVDVVVGDAGRWLRKDAEPHSVQLLHVDLYDEQAAAPVLDDEAFYADCRRLLADGGVMSVNLFGRDASFERSIARIAAVFGEAHVWSLRPTREGNTAAIATRGALLPPRTEVLARAADLEARFGAFGLQARKWPRMLRAHLAPLAPDQHPAPQASDQPPAPQTPVGTGAAAASDEAGR